MSQPSAFIGLEADANYRPVPQSADGPGKSVCIVGGHAIVRRGIRDLLIGKGFSVNRTRQSLDELFEDPPAWQRGILVLIVEPADFSSFHRLTELGGDVPPTVVLSAKANRAHVYAAIRAGVLGYVNLDAQPEELVQAVELAAGNHSHLSPAAAELLVEDISQGRSLRQGQAASTMGLSTREMEIVQLLCQGLSSKEIGRCLHISSKTVENHRYNIYRKWNLNNLASLIRFAIHEGVVSP